MNQDPVDQLAQLGFSEYEAKAYVALLRENPITGYQLAKLSGVPRSMIYEVLGKLTARGAAITLRKEGSTLYAPIAADEFLDQLHREHEDLIGSLKDSLTAAEPATDLDYVWNIEGHDNIMAKAEEMIDGATRQIYLAVLPAIFPDLRAVLGRAIERGVRVVVYSMIDLDLPGGRVIVTSVSEEAQERVEGLWLILVVDEEQVLIGELLTENQARASWTGSSLFVFVAEHHLRTDPYLPQILNCLGEQAVQLIREEDRDLFARAMESRIER